MCVSHGPWGRLTLSSLLGGVCMCFSTNVCSDISSNSIGAPFLLKKLFNSLFLSFFEFRATHTAYGIPRPGVKLELWLPAYATATATQDPSCICDLHHSSQQHQILNPLSEARDRTHNLLVPSRIHFRCAIDGNASVYVFC